MKIWWLQNRKRFLALTMTAILVVAFLSTIQPVVAQCDPNDQTCLDKAAEVKRVGDFYGSTPGTPKEVKGVGGFYGSTSSATEGCGIDCWGQYIIAGFFNLILRFLGFLIATLVGILIPIGAYNGFITAPVVVQGWNIVRDISNMFFVLVLLIIAFGTILHVEQYQMKKLLPKVLLMAVLVNFSKAIAGLLIDFAQVVMLTFVAAYQQTGSGNFLQALKLDKITSIGSDTNVAGTTLQGTGKDAAPVINIQGIVGAYLLAVAYAVVSLVVILAYLIIFVVRIAALWILVIFSPLAYVLSVIPAGQKYASKWWDEFAKYVIVGPVLAFFLWLSLATLPSVSTTVISINLKTGESNKAITNVDKTTGKVFLENSPEAAIVEAGSAQHLLGFLISIAMLMMSLAFAQEVGGVVGKIAGGAFEKIQKGGMAPLKLGKWMGGAALGSLGEKITEKTGIPLKKEDWQHAWQERRQRLSDIRTMRARQTLKGVFEESSVRGMTKRAYKNVRYGQERTQKEYDELKKKKEESEARKKYASGFGAVGRKEAVGRVRALQNQIGGTFQRDKSIDDQIKDVRSQAEWDADGHVIRGTEKDGRNPKDLEQQMEIHKTQKEAITHERESLRTKLMAETQGLLSSGSMTADGTVVSEYGNAMAHIDEHGRFRDAEGTEIEVDGDELKSLLPANDQVFANSQKALVASKLTIARTNQKAIESGLLSEGQAITQLSEINKELRKLEALQKDHERSPAGYSNEQRQANTDRIKGQTDKMTTMRSYLNVLRHGGDLAAFDKVADVQESSIKDKEKRMGANERQEKIAEYGQQVKEFETWQEMGKTGKPLTMEEFDKLDQEIEKLTKVMEEKQELLGEMKMPGEFHRRAGDRELVEKEKAKMKTTNWHEILRYMKEAQKSGDRYRFVAAYEKMSESKNYNEALSGMGYTSDPAGLQRFMEKEYKNVFYKGDNSKAAQQSMLGFGNDISNIAEEVGHWNVARMVHVDPLTGEFRWQTEQEQTLEVKAELGKMSPAEIVRRYNRLALMGETANKDGRHAIMGPLAMMMMKKLQDDLPRFISRRELTKNMAERLLDGMENMATKLPSELEPIRAMLKKYVGSSGGDDAEYAAAKGYLAEEGGNEEEDEE